MTTGLQAKACASCGVFSLDSSLACRKCGAAELSPILLTGAGTVYSYCSIQVPPTALRDQAPYVLLIVQLDKGPISLGRWASNSEPRIGMLVMGEPDAQKPDLIWFKPQSETATT
ncbi:MAG TPA: OB-fold domain-containing protein [Candidatus Dormibacteraeota bacterium]